MLSEEHTPHDEAQTRQSPQSDSSGPQNQDHASASSLDAHTPSRTRSWFHRLLKGTGFLTVLRSSSDVKLILAQRFVRIFAFGLVSLLLAAYLAALGHSETQIGMFFALTLIGDLVIVMVLTQIADAFSRKTVLTIGAVSMTTSGIVFALTDNYWILLTAAIVGVVSPSATEVGPFKSIEESALFTLVTENLVDVLSWYGTAEFPSLATGLAVSGGIMNYLQASKGWNFVSACRFVFVLYAAIGILKIVLSSCMSSRIEAWYDLTAAEQQQRSQRGEDQAHESVSSEPGARDDTQSQSIVGVDEHAPLLQSNVPEIVDAHKTSKDTVTTRQSRISARLLNSVFALDHTEKILLLKLCALMGVDSCAVGMSSVPWQTYYVRTNFSVSNGPLGLIFFTANVLGACGTISSNALARRMGNLVLHFVVVVILAESFFEPIYIAPRNVFIGRIINKKKRTAILGIINMVKILTNASGSFFTGLVADRNLFWLAFVVAGSLKLTYVLAFLYAFLALDRKMEKDIKKMAIDTERDGPID